MTKFIELHDYMTGNKILVNLHMIFCVNENRSPSGKFEYTVLSTEGHTDEHGEEDYTQIFVRETYTELRQMLSNATGGVEWSQGASCSGSTKKQRVSGMSGNR